jgi:hypothetical protein
MSNREAVLDLLHEILDDIGIHDHVHNRHYRELAELLALPETFSWRDELEKALGLGGERLAARSPFLDGTVSGVDPNDTLGTYWTDVLGRWVNPRDPDWDDRIYRTQASVGPQYLRHPENELRHRLRAQGADMVSDAIIQFLRVSS